MALQSSKSCHLEASGCLWASALLDFLVLQARLGRDHHCLIQPSLALTITQELGAGALIWQACGISWQLAALQVTGCMSGSMWSTCWATWQQAIPASHTQARYSENGHTKNAAHLRNPRPMVAATACCSRCRRSIVVLGLHVWSSFHVALHLTEEGWYLPAKRRLRGTQHGLH